MTKSAALKNQELEEDDFRRSVLNGATFKLDFDTNRFGCKRLPWWGLLFGLSSSVCGVLLMATTLARNIGQDEKCRKQVRLHPT